MCDKLRADVFDFLAAYSTAKSIQHSAQFFNQYSASFDFVRSKKTKLDGQCQLCVQFGKGAFRMRDELNKLTGRVPSLPFSNI